MFTVPKDDKTSYLHFECISQVENKEEAEEYWFSLKEHDIEYNREREQLKKAFDQIYKHRS